MKAKQQGYTKLYDYVVDHYLPRVSGSELKLLIVIIKQTIGWNKKRDRISHGFFMKKTALARRSVTCGISSLEKKRMIRISDSSGNVLDAHQRKYRNTIYYELVRPKAEIANPKANNAHTKAKSAFTQRHYLPITIDTHNRKKKGSLKTIKKQTDDERLADIYQNYRPPSS